MTILKITFEEPAWPYVDGKVNLHVKDGIEATMLVGGMSSGRSSVALLIPTGEDSYGLVEVSLDHLEALVKACRGREAHLKDLKGYKA